MMKHKDFAVFILSHGRPHNQITLRTLKKLHYSGKLYIIIDNEDNTADEYFKLYGSEVIQFDKSKVKVDVMDNFVGRGIVLYARNKAFDIANDLGLKYFLVLDDDYDRFNFRKKINGELKNFSLKEIDRVFDTTIDFLEVSNAKTVCFGQSGDFIGGVSSNLYRQQILRKAMNSFFFKTDNRVEFLGRLNEDVNLYTSYGNKGDLFLTVRDVSISQVLTQQNSGGLTEEYLNKGTYVKSFYSVMLCPSFVSIGILGGSGKKHAYYRIHHNIKSRYGYPKIISDKYKKVG